MKKTTKNVAFVLAMLAGGLFSAKAQQPLKKAIAKTKQVTKVTQTKDFQLTEETKRSIQVTGYARCLTTENEHSLKEQDPNRATTQEFEQMLAPIIAKIKADRAAGKAPQVVYNIPVVVHVISDGDPVNNTGQAGNENISEAQALSQITVMNDDYRRMAGTRGGANSTGAAVDCEINFCIAQLDPNGVATTGVVRHTITPYSNADTPGVADDWETRADVEQMKANTQWDPTRYLNMWTFKPGGLSLQNGGLSGLLGYAQFPSNSGLPGLAANGGAANTDGVVAGYDAFGSADDDDGSFILNPNYNLGRTMTHEVGHWLGLRHIWGDTGTCGNDDFCADTPDATTEHYQCNVYDTCPSDGLGNDMVQNYMDYTNDACMDTFTQNQKDRIQAVMQICPRRMELNSSPACSVTPNFTIATGNLGNCGADSASTTVDFTTLNGFSENTVFTLTGLPAGAAYLFSPTSLSATGTTTLTVTGLNGVADGTYTVTIEATAPSLTKTLAISLIDGANVCAATATTPFATSITLVNFNTINKSSSSPAGTGADNQATGYSDFSATESTDVNIDSTYDLSVNVDADGTYRTQTKVWIDWNQNCNFDIPSEEYDLGQGVLTQNGPTFNVPTENSPLAITVPSNAVLGATTMRVAVRYSSPDAPYDYPTPCGSQVDGEVEDYRINVLQSLSVNDNDFALFNVYPNPSNGVVNITLGTDDDVKVSLFDVRGRKVYNKAFTNNSATFTKTLNFNAMASGVYLLTIESGAKKATKKLVIQ